MRMLWVMVLALAACQHDQASELEAACTHVCRCDAAPLPAAQQQCMTTCLQGGEVTTQDTCIECILESADECSTLNTTCQRVCIGPETGGGDDSI